MKSSNKIILCLMALLMIAGCASTKITGRDEIVTGKLPRPNTIWVYEFAATPADVPTVAPIAARKRRRESPLERSMRYSLWRQETSRAPLYHASRAPQNQGGDAPPMAWPRRNPLEWPSLTPQLVRVFIMPGYS